MTPILPHHLPPNHYLSAVSYTGGSRLSDLPLLWRAAQASLPHVYASPGTRLGFLSLLRHPSHASGHAKPAREAYAARLLQSPWQAPEPSRKVAHKDRSALAETLCLPMHGKGLLTSMGPLPPSLLPTHVI